jgi:hypothetical protein
MAPKFPCIGAVGLVGFLASCSDPVPPASQGSASIHFQGPSMEAAAAGKQCPAGVHFADAPSAFTTQQRTTGASRPTDANKQSIIAVDGEQSRQFQCSVVASGDKFSVSGSMNVPAFDKDMKPIQIPTQIQLSTTIGKGESGAMGRLAVSDNATAGNFYQATDCLFSVKSDAANPKLNIDAGKMWGSVTCSNFTLPDDPSSSCVIDSGYFILENCDQ